MVHDQQQIVPFPVNPPQSLVQVRKAGPPLEQPVEVPLETGSAFLRRTPR